jgi:hypothetical protein
MQGILGKVGEALKTLQDREQAIVTPTDECEIEDILYYIEDVLKGLKVTFKTTINKKKSHALIKIYS